jgi:universal stress protein A
MSYQHILVAVDLTDDSQTVILKAIRLAKDVNAEVSFIHIDINHSELYTGLIDLNMRDSQNHAYAAAHEKLQHLAQQADVPVKHTLVSHGEFSDEIVEAISERKVDLLVCGHHQDFWSRIVSSTRQLINSTPVDMLIVPIKH